MKEFFNVISIEAVRDLARSFPMAGEESVPVFEARGRVLSRDVVSPENVPDFARSTMDGYAVCASSTFGASESIPAMLDVIGRVEMGKTPDFFVGPGQAAIMPTGGMMPSGADAVVMVEHTEALDGRTIEVYRSAAPLAHMLSAGDDVKQGDVVLKQGSRLRPQDLAVAAAVGRCELPVRRRPVAGILSTGDEVVPADAKPGPGQIRDMNTYALAGMCVEAGAAPVSHGVVGDDREALAEAMAKALEESDAVLISGGSSVGARDHTIDVIGEFSDSEILVHGVSISPGKPTILARVGGKAVWGLPGHVVSAMIVFTAMVDPFFRRLGGLPENSGRATVQARLSRNVPSVMGRTDYVRVRLRERGGQWIAEPVFGKSGIVRTMVEADGLIQVGVNDEGLDPGAEVLVELFR